MKTVIRNGRIVTAVDDYNADLLIEDGKVAMIAKSIDFDADRVQHPPRAGRGVRAVLVVVHEDVRLRRDAPLRDLPAPLIDGRQRVASAARGVARRRQLRLRIRVNRALAMPRLERGARTGVQNHRLHA